MSKKDEIFEYLSNNNEKSKDVLIILLIQNFSINKATATNYYYNWKKRFMGNDNCIPKKKSEYKSNEPKERPNIKIQHDVPPIDVNKIDVFEKPKMRVIEGEITYKGKKYYVKDGVLVVGEETFKSMNELEEYKKNQLKEFYSQISDIADVLESMK